MDKNVFIQNLKDTTTVLQQLEVCIKYIMDLPDPVTTYTQEEIDAKLALKQNNLAFNPENVATQALTKIEGNGTTYKIPRCKPNSIIVEDTGAFDYLIFSLLAKGINTFTYSPNTMGDDIEYYTAVCNARYDSDNDEYISNVYYGTYSGGSITWAKATSGTLYYYSEENL